MTEKKPIVNAVSNTDDQDVNDSIAVNPEKLALRNTVQLKINAMRDQCFDLDDAEIDYIQELLAENDDDEHFEVRK